MAGGRGEYFCKNCEKKDFQLAHFSSCNFIAKCSLLAGGVPGHRGGRHGGGRRGVLLHPHRQHRLHALVQGGHLESSRTRLHVSTEKNPRRSFGKGHDFHANWNQSTIKFCLKKTGSNSKCVFYKAFNASHLRIPQ